MGTNTLRSWYEADHGQFTRSPISHVPHPDEDSNRSLRHSRSSPSLRSSAWDAGSDRGVQVSGQPERIARRIEVRPHASPKLTKSFTSPSKTNSSAVLQRVGMRWSQ